MARKPKKPKKPAQGALFATPASLPPFARRSDTSREAAESVKETAAGMRAKVLAYVTRIGPDGATYDDIQIALRMLAQTVSARCNELVERGDLVDTGKRRRTRTGCNARVLVATVPHLPAGAGQEARA